MNHITLPLYEHSIMGMKSLQFGEGFPISIKKPPHLAGAWQITNGQPLASRLASLASLHGLMLA
jgi:hypothetical protein